MSETSWAEGDQDLRYVVLLSQVPGVETSRELVRRHVEFLRRLDRRGRLELCGPFLDYHGGMVILRASSLDEAMALAGEDPFVAEGARTAEVRTWKLSSERNNHLGMG